MPNLLQLLKNEDANIRKAAALALGYKGEKTAGKAIIPLLKDKHWQIRLAAVQALEMLKFKDALPYLFNRLGIDKSSGRKVIMDILAVKKPPVEEEKPDNKIEASFRVKRAIAKAIAKIDENFLIKPLISSLNSDNINMQLAAISGLGNIGASDAVEPLLEILNSDNILLVKATIVSLGKIKSPEAVDALIKLANHKDAQIRLETLIALNHIKDDKALPVFMELINDTDVNVRRTAVIALGNTRNENVFKYILEKISDHSLIVRKAAISSLVNFKNEEAVSAIINTLENEIEESILTEAALIFNKIIPGFIQ